MDYDTGYADGFWIAFLLQYLFTISFIVVAIIALKIIAFWKIFEKADQKGWYSVIPLYNSYKIFEIVFGTGWYFLLLFIPFIGWITGIVLTYQLGKAFGKSTAFCLGLVFFPYIFCLILGFGDSKYIGLNENV